MKKQVTTRCQKYVNIDKMQLCQMIRLLFELGNHLRGELNNQQPDWGKEEKIFLIQSKNNQQQDNKKKIKKL